MKNLNLESRWKIKLKCGTIEKDLTEMKSFKTASNINKIEIKSRKTLINASGAQITVICPWLRVLNIHIKISNRIP